MTEESECRPLLRRASSRDSLISLRDSKIISPGGSQALYLASVSVQKGPRKSTLAEEQLTYITNIIQDLYWILSELGDGTCHASASELEMWACFLDRQLSQSSRNYHSLSHVFAISAGASPLQVLAALFRDAVNYAIDGGDVANPTAQGFDASTSSRNVTVESVLHGFLIPGTHTVAPDLPRRDRLVVHIFGFQPEQDLSSARGWHKGLDTFLSAALACRMLRQYLTESQEVELCVCLEATIPNRLRDNINPMEDLFQRLQDTNTLFGLGMAQEDMIGIVHLACDQWNRQVGNLMSDSLATVLDHTWMLLPEVNPALRKRALFTLNEYHVALQSMTNVIRTMKGSTIVMSFRGIPTRNETIQFEHAVNKNMELVVLYMNARLLSVVIVAALACLTGGDAPKSFFFGDVPLPHEHEVMDMLGDKLLEDEDRIDTSASFQPEVYASLAGEGMEHTSSFDIRQAPLAAYLHRTLGDDRIAKFLQDHKVLSDPLPLEEGAARKYLRGLPRPVIITVAEEMSRFTVSRAAALDRIIPSL